MFGSLISGKFFCKCKHAVKCINSRIGTIRRKKQATVKFLKKDVADLLADGHDSNAFGRTEALIIEINHASCYDMIEQYCDCILKQLPRLQKQRECPEEAREAVSTLIFAAARFSDLPELCDLRRVFSERYGSHMEESVNAEFAANVQKKSFPMDKKLQLMQDIAEEFSVKWNAKAFQQKLTNPPSAPVSDRSKKSNVSDAKASPVENGKNEAVKGRKGAVINVSADEEVPSHRRCNPPPRSLTLKQQAQPETRDIHVVPSITTSSHTEPAEKTRKKVSSATAVESENVGPLYANGGGGPLYVQPNGIQNGTHKDYHLNEGTARNRFSKVQEGPGLVGIERQSVQPVISRDAKVDNMIPPYTNGKGRNRSDDRAIGSANDELLKGEKGLDPTIHDKEPAKLASFNNGYDRPMNKGRNGFDGRVIGAASDELLKGEKGLDSTTQDKEPARLASSNNGYERPLNMIPPPYTKPMYRNPSALADDTKHTDLPVNSSSTADGERSNGGERPKPFSVRRNKTPPVSETDNTIDYGKPVIRNQSDRGKEGRHGRGETILDRHPRQTVAEDMNGAGKYDEDANEDHMLVLRRMRKGQRKQGRQTSEDFCGEGENVMDLHPRQKVPKDTCGQGGYDDTIDDSRPVSRTQSSQRKEVRQTNADFYDKEENVTDRHPRKSMTKDMDSAGRYGRFDGNIDDVKLVSQTRSSRRRECRQINDDSYGEDEKIMNRQPRQTVAEDMDGAGRHDRQVSRSSSGRRRHTGRRNTATYDGDCDEDEAAMDRLLAHFSRKGMANDQSKLRTKMRPPPVELNVDAGRNGQQHHYGNGRVHPGPKESAHHTPTRIASLPPEPASSADAVSKAPLRATSMQPDMLSPNGVRVHPRLPDYDELTARFNALRKT